MGGQRNGPPYPLGSSQNAELSVKDLSNKNYSKYIKAGAIVAGSILVAGGGLYLYKLVQPDYHAVHIHGGPLRNYLEDFPDDNSMSFKKGTVFQRISAEANQEYMNRGSTYVSAFFRDKVRYMSRLLSESWNKGSQMYVHHLRTKIDIHVPSSRKAAEIFLSINPDAKHSDYMNFITYGIRDGSAERDSFIKALKNAGFNALIDENDRGWTKAPIILIDPGQTCITFSRKLHKVEEVAATILK